MQDSSMRKNELERIINSLTDEYSRLKTPSNRSLSMTITKTVDKSSNIFACMMKKAAVRSDTRIKEDIDRMREIQVNKKEAKLELIIGDAGEDNSEGNNDESEEAEKNDPIKKYLKYTNEFRLIAVTEAKLFTVPLVADRLNIPLGTLERWITKYNKHGENSLNDGRTTMSGVKAKYPDEENKLTESIVELRQKGVVVNLAYIKNMALKLIRDKHEEFKCSINWIYCFLKRNDFVLRRKTNTVTKAPEELAVRVFSYLAEVQTMIRENSYDGIFNMDECGVFYDLSGSYTYDKVGNKDISVKSHYAKKKKLSVFLCVGVVQNIPVKMNPAVIFKSVSKTGKSYVVNKLTKEFGDNASIGKSSSGWNDIPAMSSWVDEFLEMKENLKLASVLLVMDGYYSHENPFIIRKLESAGVTVKILPGGCTPIIQPLDVVINKPFKTALTQFYHSFIETTLNF